MAISTELWSFALVVGLFTLTPGLDTALILRTSAVGRRARAWGVVIGIQTGTLLWGTFASLGVTALFTASHLAYTAMRWVGAAYLVWMGVQMLRNTFRRSSAPDTGETEVLTGADSFGAGWRQGLLTNLLNPKVGVFYAAVLPQFMPAGTNHLAMGLLLTTVHILLGLTWSAVLVGFARILHTWLRKPQARRVLDRVTGTVIVGFGVRLALGD